MPPPPAATLFPLGAGGAVAAGTLLGARGSEELVQRLAAGRAVAVAAQRFTMLAGMVEAGGEDRAKPATVRTLFVAPRHRSLGIGTLLLRAVEQPLAAAGWRSASVIVARPLGGGALPIDRVLEKADWPPARKRTKIFRVATPQAILEEAWTRFRLPSTFEIVAWGDVTERELAEVRSAEDGLRDDEEYISPFIEGVDLASSLGLRHRGRLVGWMINRRPHGKLIVFDRFYIHRECQGLRGGLPLLAESIRRALEVPGSRGMFQAPVRLEKQIRLYHKLMGRHFTSVEEEWASEKHLGGPAPAG